MDANIQRILLDGDLTLALKLSDVFDTREWSYLSDFATLYQENRFKRESRNFFLTATWKIESWKSGGDQEAVEEGTAEAQRAWSSECADSACASTFQGWRRVGATGCSPVYTGLPRRETTDF